MDTIRAYPWSTVVFVTLLMSLVYVEENTYNLIRQLLQEELSNRGSSCPRGSYRDGDTCSWCSDGCWECTSPTLCTDCKFGYYRDGDTCSRCSYGCWECTSPTLCTDCSLEYYLDGQGGCSPCSDGCYWCTSPTHCTGCSLEYYSDGHAACSPCNSSSQCSWCKRVWSGNLCAGCVAGKYGDDCKQMCPVNCKYHTCEKTDGTCTSGCQSGYFGANCNMTCSASYCFDDTCDQQSGHCGSCKFGFYGYDCTEHCSTKCRNGTCLKTNGTCFSDCKPGFSGDRCCTRGDNCRICSSNDNCQTCVPGWHGDQCDERCPENCADAGCHLKNGECFNCESHRYGLKCEHECNVNCVQDDNNTCSKNGTCLFGCVTGYSGTSCSEGTSAETSTPTLPIVASVVGVALIALVIVVILVVVKKIRSRENARKHEVVPDSSAMVESRQEHEMESMSRTVDDGHEYEEIPDRDNTPEPEPRPNVYDQLNLPAEASETGYTSLDEYERPVSTYMRMDINIPVSKRFVKTPLKKNITPKISGHKPGGSISDQSEQRLIQYEIMSMSKPTSHPYVNTSQWDTMSPN